MRDPDLCVMTWNINGAGRFHRASEDDRALEDAFTRHVTGSNPDIVCLQEDEPDSPACDRLKAALFGSAYRALDVDCRDDHGLANTILVKAALMPRVAPLPGFIFAGGRTATAIDLGGRVLVNTHLPGGRFDDRQFRQRMHDKVEMMRAIVARYDAPALVCGDFNGSVHDEAVLEGYALYRQLPTPDERAAFLQYYAGVHRYLADAGYVPSSHGGQPTSIFGTSPDWIYSWRTPPASSWIVPAFEARGALSDHHAVCVRVGWP